ncbi:hypothetical protein GGQ60_003738 [Pedobacter zeae]|uniref:Uncharacterized protein n=1 Tax=Pedobacter zeae TaxID=1737356 RepID=A0A7W6P6J2_9SPHI|nr:hypothetical protein [Pedobacter zeae]
MKHISDRLCPLKIALTCLILSAAGFAMAQQKQSLPIVAG